MTGFIPAVKGVCHGGKVCKTGELIFFLFFCFAELFCQHPPPIIRFGNVIRMGPERQGTDNQKDF